MLDAMLIARRCQDLVQAQFCRVPDGPMHATVWVDKAGRLCAWHPLLREPLRADSAHADWDAELFGQSAQSIERGLSDYLRQLLEAQGAPASYFSNYPNVVSDMRRGQANFTAMATAQDDADAAAEIGGHKAPSLDVLGQRT